MHNHNLPNPHLSTLINSDAFKPTSSHPSSHSIGLAGTYVLSSTQRRTTRRTATTRTQSLFSTAPLLSSTRSTTWSATVLTCRPVGQQTLPRVRTGVRLFVGLLLLLVVGGGGSILHVLVATSSSCTMCVVFKLVFDLVIVALH
jgi:hypothetical protein